MSLFAAVGYYSGGAHTLLMTRTRLRHEPLPSCLPLRWLGTAAVVVYVTYIA
jgi:hypothetical protein